MIIYAPCFLLPLVTEFLSLSAFSGSCRARPCADNLPSASLRVVVSCGLSQVHRFSLISYLQKLALAVITNTDAEQAGVCGWGMWGTKGACGLLERSADEASPVVHGQASPWSYHSRTCAPFIHSSPPFMQFMTDEREVVLFGSIPHRWGSWALNSHTLTSLHEEILSKERLSFHWAVPS